jgi:hypothetical protein
MDDGSCLFEECFPWPVLTLLQNTKPTTEGLFQLHETVCLGVTVEGTVNQVSPEEVKVGAGLFQECAKLQVIMVYVGGEYQVHDQKG